jgi:hypothetical protein
MFKRVKLIELTELVPEGWDHWFYELLSESQPSFSWGDNNRTLITAERLLHQCEDILSDIHKEIEEVDEQEVNYFLARLESLGQTYIDLEN